MATQLKSYQMVFERAQSDTPAQNESFFYFSLSHFSFYSEISAKQVEIRKVDQLSKCLAMKKMTEMYNNLLVYTLIEETLGSTWLNC